MIQMLSDDILLQLSKFIASNLALYFSKERWNDLERNIITASNEFGYADVEKFINHIISSPLNREHSELLASHLTVNETFFWREPQSFDALEQKIIPEIIRLKQNGEKRIRIWSAGCSTGEEPYSIAMALHRTIPDIKDWNITILATDINPRILFKAKSGLYRQWSFRGEPKWLKEKYFLQKDKNLFELIPSIKKMVQFEYLNLAEDIFPSQLNNTNAMDLIFCRNVLMYFSPERFRQVGQRFYNSLINEGYLIVSASELSVQNFPDFVPVNVPGLVLYKKTSKSTTKQHYDADIKLQSEPELFQKLPNLHPVFEKIKPLFPEKEKELLPIEKINPETGSNYEKNLQLYSRGNYAEVIDKLKNKEQTSSELILLIRAHANQGKYTEALELCDKAITIHKLDPRFYFLIATIQQENNQQERATISLKRAIYLDPDFVLSYFLLGNIYKQQGKITKAKKCFENILTIVDKFKYDDSIFESEGLTVARFREIVNANIRVNG